MNDCQDIRQLLLELRLVGEERRRAALLMLEHLNTCAACRAAASDYDRLFSQLDRPARLDEADREWESIQPRLDRASPARKRWRLSPMRAAAAALILGALGVGLGRWTINVAPPNAAVISTPHGPNPRALEAGFAPGEIRRQALVFNEISNEFDRRTAWVADSPESSDLGLSDHPMPPGQILLVRLTILQGGQVTSKADLAIVPGQAAKLTVPLGDQEHVEYQIGTDTRQPTTLTIAAQLRTPLGDQPLGALATTLNLKPGEKVSAGDITTCVGNYELVVAFSRCDLPGVNK